MNTCAPRRGKWHIEDEGAVPVFLGDDLDQANPALRSANRAAIQATWAKALASPNGGEIEAGPGVYLTNDFTGLDLHEDRNVSVTFKGVGGFTAILSNNQEAAAMQLHTSSGNLRGITVERIVLRGGREGLSLRQCAYNTFERVWFWGSKNVGLNNEVGARNTFHKCRFDEGAQGTGNGTTADALVFTSCEDTLSDCTFGEYSGGLIFNGGANSIDNCQFADTFTRRAIWYSYVDGVIIDQAANLLPMKAGIILWQGSLSINGAHGKAAHRFVSAFRAYELLINGVRMQTDQDFDFTGFVDVRTGGGTPLALKVSGCQFVWLGGKSGYLVADPDNVLHDAMIDAQLTAYLGSTITPLSSSAPSLLNPGSENNLVQLRTFQR